MFKRFIIFVVTFFKLKSDTKTLRKNYNAWASVQPMQRPTKKHYCQRMIDLYKCIPNGYWDNFNVAKFDRQMKAKFPHTASEFLEALKTCDAVISKNGRISRTFIFESFVATTQSNYLTMIFPHGNEVAILKETFEVLLSIEKRLSSGNHPNSTYLSMQLAFIDVHYTSLLETLIQAVLAGKD